VETLARKSATGETTASEIGAGGRAIMAAAASSNGRTGNGEGGGEARECAKGGAEVPWGHLYRLEREGRRLPVAWPSMAMRPCWNSRGGGRGIKER
jgi:hypothetical protein